MKLNTNSNAYTIAYAVGVVVIVAFLLAFVSSALKAPSEANERMDKQKQILASLNLNPDKAQIEEEYKKVVKADPIVDQDGNTVKTEGGFGIAMKDIGKPSLPVYICQINGETKYVLPLVGKGLWGQIWGYVAVNADCKTVYGAYFSHQSETAGLGALISEKKFQDEFKGKELKAADGTLLSVVKYNSKQDKPNVQCDGISGATLTTNGVNAMLHDYIHKYENYLSKQRK